MPHPVLLVNGPNLNTLGTREPEIYGHETLADIEAACKKAAASLGLSMDCFQSNHEGELVDQIQKAGKTHKGLLINAGAYTHTSIAIMDALLTLSIPVIEVHMSNIFRRESFRHESYVSKAAKGVICGFGSDSYLLGLQAIAKLVK
ncbi:MAG: type II 3-dehydroquinate dehydratase [Rickettsiales bacterium]|nr:type II 3-dehydroquinate dehydratase [Rickettsiales bacterium]